MLGAASLICIVLGSPGAIAAQRFPAYTAAIETGAGILFIGGVALAGSLLPVLP
jgi:hypothetical protein